MPNFRFFFATFLMLALGFMHIACNADSETFTVEGAASSADTNSKLGVLTSRVVGGSPTSFNITLYGAYISESADCSDPILLEDFGSDGETFDLYTNPTLFSGSPPDGTYNCLILNFSDTFTFLANSEGASTHAGCTDTETEFSHDVYRDGEEDDGEWVDLDGEGIDATGSRAEPGPDNVFAFATVQEDYIGVVANDVQVNEYQHIVLSSPLVVPGQTTFYFDANDGLSNSEDGDEDYCVVEEGSMGFR